MKAKAKVPSVIPVLGILVFVEFSDDFAKEHGTDGEFDPNTRTIKLDSLLLQNPITLKETLNHEIGHAWLEYSGLRQSLNGDAQEMAVQTYAVSIEQIYTCEFLPHLI